jgi:hypothetical protein
MDQQPTPSLSHEFRDINRAKADFDSIYNAPDPRSYYRVLGGLDYVVPALAAPVFRQLIAARAASQERPVTVLDLGCSYGTTSLLLRFPLSFDQIRHRYMNPAIQSLDPDAVRKLDRAYFRSWPRENDFRIIGLDPSGNAVRYATDVGILDFGIEEDLEHGAPSSRSRIALSEVDIVISTGCVGYVSESTFDTLMALNRNPRAPWVASFVLRMFPYDTVEDTLSSYGLVTEKFEGATFVQRRFHSAEEYEQTLETLERGGIDPTGREADGLFHAELFVSRPEAEIAKTPINRLISIVSGQRGRYGRRYHRIEGMGATELLIN